MLPASVRRARPGSKGGKKATRNEGTTHDIVDNKGPALGTHDLHENNTLSLRRPRSITK
jgi:hypothetical protein